MISPLRRLQAGSVFRGGGINWASHWASKTYTERIDYYFGNNLVAHWPLNETSGDIAQARGIAPTSQQIFPNQGFEAYSEEVFSITNATRTLTTSAGEFHSGSKAVKLARTAGTGSMTITLPITPGANYTFKFWCRGDGTNPVNYSIARQDYGAWIVAPVNTGVSGTVFQQVTSPEFTAPEGYNYIIINFLTANAAGAVIYIDDIELIPSAGVSINDLNGIYTNCTLNQSSFKTGEKSILLDGSVGAGVVLRPLIFNEFPQTGQGTLLIWAKPTLASLTDGVSRFIVKFKTVSSSANANFADMFKYSDNNTFGYQFKDDTMTADFTTTSISTSSWNCFAMTWHPTDGLKHFVNGVRVGNAIPISGSFTKVFNGSIGIIGAEAIYVNSFSGNLCHCVVGKTALNETAMKWLGIA